MDDMKAKPVSHISLSQKPDPKKKQVINLDQDVQVCGYFWWMVYELLCMNHLSFPFSFDKGLSFLFIFFDMPKHMAYLLWVCIFYPFFLHAEACGIPSLDMHLLFLFFLHSPISLIYF